MHTFQLSIKRFRLPLLRHCYLLLFLMLPFPLLAQSQAQQPTLSEQVVKVAYVDHSRLRKEYSALTAAREKAKKEWQASEDGYRAKLDELAAQDTSRRQSLEQSQQERRKRLHQQRVASLQGHERRIALAIGEVASRGGFTDIKPLEKKPLPSQGQDITDLILKELN